jgi:putative two-component system response regulator
VTDTITGASVLIVDDAADNLRLLAAVVKKGGLVPRPVTSGKRAIEAAVVDPPDLVLLDIRMPEMSGLDVCRWFKKDERLRDIPVIFISGLSDSDDKIEGFRLGGVDYITKPFHDQEVLARIETHLRLRALQKELSSHNQRLEERVEEAVKATAASHMATIFALVKLAEVRDRFRGRHVERVQVLTKILAERLRDTSHQKAQLTPDHIDCLAQTACLHDIGKVGVPDAILLKPGKLSEVEFDEMKKHCRLGADTLAEVRQRYPENQFLRMGVEVARSHHENWDGSGYPDGLKGSEIPLAARIVALADSYDALTSERYHHPPYTHEKASRMIEEGSGTQFDPDVVAAFLSLGEQFRQIRAGMHD